MNSFQHSAESNMSNEHIGVFRKLKQSNSWVGGMIVASESVPNIFFGIWYRNTSFTFENGLEFQSLSRIIKPSNFSNHFSIGKMLLVGKVFANKEFSPNLKAWKKTTINIRKVCQHRPCYFLAAITWMYKKIQLRSSFPHFLVLVLFLAQFNFLHIFSIPRFSDISVSMLKFQ